MADIEGISPFFQELVTSVAKANHNYFARRGQTRVAWEGVAPIYQHAALGAHLEILSDGPSQLIAQAINDAKQEAPVLRLRIEMFIAELRESDVGQAAPVRLAIADELQALIDRPLEGD